MTERVGILSKLERPPIVSPFHLEPKFPDPGRMFIQVAPTGGQITRQQNPNQPYSPKEIAMQTIRAYKEGATILHVHVRDDYGFGSGDPELYRETIDLVKKECPNIITSFCVTRPFEKDTIEERVKAYPLELADIAIINMGSMNIGPLVLRSSRDYIVSATKYLQDIGVKPEIAAYNLSMIEYARELLIESKILEKPYFFNLLIGVHNSIPARLENVRLMLDYLREKVPDAIWMVTAGGRLWIPILTETILLGGHVRVGMEDNVYMYPWKDDLIDDCGKLVTKIVRIAKEIGREIATPNDVRKILGLSTE